MNKKLINQLISAYATLSNQHLVWIRINNNYPIFDEHDRRLREILGADNYEFGSFCDGDYISNVAVFEFKTSEEAHEFEQKLSDESAWLTYQIYKPNGEQ